MEELENFLRKREIKEEAIKRLKDEKIDLQTILSMTDDQLRTFIPKMGDLIAVRKYCQNSDIESRKMTLLKKLRRKLGRKRPNPVTSSDSDEEMDQRSTKLKGNANARKGQRKIELGWCHYNECVDRYQQIRKRNGGGTRELKCNLNWKSEDILQYGKKIFFPDGYSVKGKESEFSFCLQDFKQCNVSNEISLEEMYQQSHMKILRFYIFTKKLNASECKMASDESDPDEYSLTEKPLPPLHFPQPRKRLQLPKKTSTITQSEQLSVDDLLEDQEVPIPRTYKSTETLPKTPETHGNKSQDSIHLAENLTESSAGPFSEFISTPVNIVVDDDIIFSVNTDTYAAFTSMNNQEYILEDNRDIPDISFVSSDLTMTQGDVSTNLPVTPEDVSSNLPVTPEDASSNLPVTPEDASSNLPLTPEDVSSNLPVTQEDVSSNLPVTQEGVSSNLPVTQEDLSSNLPVTQEDLLVNNSESLLTQESSTLVPEVEVNSNLMKFHLGNCYFELLDMFRSENQPWPILESSNVSRVLPNGEIERAEGIGLLRDILTEFWETFYSKCCYGDETKVPFLRHDMRESEWCAIGRIISEGWNRIRYLPVQLEKAVLEEAMFGMVSGKLTPAFLRYIPTLERFTIEKALSNFESVDADDLLEVLEAHQCKKLPTSENIETIIEEIAHKEMLQEPRFIIDCWRKEFTTHLGMDQLELCKCFEEKLPTVKKILNSLRFPSIMDSNQQVTASYLKRFIKGLDRKGMENFLRFCTGANVITESINVEFTKLFGYERRPQAHTCGCILKLPSTYDNFADLREEFQNILSSGVWTMGYV